MRNKESAMGNGKKDIVKGKGICLVVGVLLFSALLFGACDNPLKSSDNLPLLGDGYGRVSIVFEGDGARTVFPAASFDSYTYTFSKGGGSGEEKTPGSGNTFVLEVGSYTVEVKAFKGAVEVASGISGTFTVAAGNSNPPVSVALAAVSGGTGDFSYTINYPTDATVAITMQKWPSGAVGLAPTVSSGKSTETLSLDSGTYLFTAIVTRGGYSAGISEAVHIYRSMSTTYTKTFAGGDLLHTQFIVSFNANGASGTPPTQQTVAPGSNIASLPGAGSLTNTGYTFGGWKNNATGVTYSAGASYTPVGDDVLYAQWILVPITFSGVTSDGGETTTTELTLTFSAAVTGLSASDITLSGVAGVIKGTLSGSGPSYTLPISGFTAGGILTVAVAKAGYDISGSPQTVGIYRKVVLPSSPIFWGNIPAFYVDGNLFWPNFGLLLNVGTLPTATYLDTITIAGKSITFLGAGYRYILVPKDLGPLVKVIDAASINVISTIFDPPDEFIYDGITFYRYMGTSGTASDSGGTTVTLEY